MEQINQIFQTKDYDKFKIREDNRSIKERHVNALVRSLQQSNDLHLNPIIVNSDNEIVDGQHRFHAARQLGLPIHYVIDDHYDPTKMMRLNQNATRWSMEDYTNFWISNGREEYQKISDLSKETEIKLSILVFILEIKDSCGFTDYKEGKFKYDINKEMEDALFTTKRLIDYLKSVNYKPIKLYNHKCFLRACKNFFLNPLVDIERFFIRMDSCPYPIKYSLGASDYIKQFVTIYNYDMKAKRLRCIEESGRVKVIL